MNSTGQFNENCTQIDCIKSQRKMILMCYSGGWLCSVSATIFLRYNKNNWWKKCYRLEWLFLTASEPSLRPGELCLTARKPENRPTDVTKEPPRRAWEWQQSGRRPRLQLAGVQTSSSGFFKEGSFWYCITGTKQWLISWDARHYHFSSFSVQLV